MPLDDEVASRLKDIAECCTAIAEYVQDTDFERFAAVRMMRAAVERELITIGEAVGAILRIDATVESYVSDPRGIVDLRNLLVHGYRRLDPRTIWTLAQTEVPVLLDEVRRLQSRP